MKLPASQILWATYYDGKGKPKWAVTSDQARVKYCLYNLGGEKPEKVKTGASPEEFRKEIGKI